MQQNNTILLIAAMGALGLAAYAIMGKDDQQQPQYPYPYPYPQPGSNTNSGGSGQSSYDKTVEDINKGVDTAANIIDKIGGWFSGVPNKGRNEGLFI